MISVIIVNYNSSDLLIDCIDSLKKQLVMDNGEIVPLEVIVIDNNSSQHEREKLSQVNHGMVRIIKQKTNMGFAGANNLGYKLSKGDFILFTNPDTYFFDGALESLYKFLKTSSAGAVGPKTFWDKKKTFLLPGSQLPTIFNNLLELSETRYLKLRKLLRYRRLKKSIAYWLEDKPLKVNMISGGCIFTRREIINKVGLFDEKYSMYFEDADWCLRVSKKGFTIYYYPAAEIAHYYNQSAKTIPDQSRRKMIKSAEIYFSKNFGLMSNCIRLLFSSLLSSNREMLIDDFEEIDVQGETSAISVVNGLSEGKKYLMEISINKLFIPSAGAFLNEPEFRIPFAILEQLEPGHYFSRLSSLADMKVIRKWHWTKKPDAIKCGNYVRK